MNRTTRREFLKQSGLMLFNVSLGQPAFDHSAAVATYNALTQTAAMSDNDRILIVIHLAGGNDGLDTVIPLSGQLRHLYEQHRPTRMIPVADLLSIGKDMAGNELGFHPSLRLIKNLYDQGRVGVIQAVGHAKESQIIPGEFLRWQQIWHAADPEGKQHTGWLGRYLDEAVPPSDSSDNPLPAIALASCMPAIAGASCFPFSLQGATTSGASVGSIAEFQLQTDTRFFDDRGNRVQGILALNGEAMPTRPMFEYVRQVALKTYEMSQALQEAARSYVPDPAIVYAPANPLAVVMQQVAQIIAANLGTKIFYVVLSWFDTSYTGGAPVHARLLDHLADAVDTFHRDMVRLGHDDNVLMMTWSEFGQTVKEDGNRRMYSGGAGPQFVFGTPVRGGLYGPHPSLMNLYSFTPTREALKFSIDFRSYYATILERWFEVDSKPILKGAFDLIPFL